MPLSVSGVLTATLPDESDMSSKLIPLLALTAAISFTGSALAQWQWTDENGRNVYSDRPPPSTIPQSQILKQPRNSLPTLAATQEESVKPAAKPEATGTEETVQVEIDPEQQKLAAEEEKKLAQEKAEIEAKNQQIKASNCANARRTIAQLEPGRRVATVNEKGETGFMNDEARSAERQRAQEVINTNCN